MEHSGGRLLGESLKTTLQNTSVRAESSAKRLANIKWIAELPRAELAFRKRTKQLLITETDKGEEIFILLPQGIDKRV